MTNAAKLGIHLADRTDKVKLDAIVKAHAEALKENEARDRALVSLALMGRAQWSWAPIENEGAYNAKIKRAMTTPCVPERCPKCGVMVGYAQKANGNRYLAEIEPEGQTGSGLYVAIKARPHFVNCAGAPAPGVIAKGQGPRGEGPQGSSRDRRSRDLDGTKRLR